MTNTPYLKLLELKGFKSFADHTTLEFVRGINVIVGPNGCGKSNIVDAIHWLFGTHSARDLRGTAQDDLIFNGTDRRAPSGFAEVKGVFVSESGFPHPQYSSLSEVEIYRRWNRGEHSEFRINRVRVRWRDLLDFLYALGWGSYSVIHQDSIQEISLATPEECRRFLEESSGISRFYLRREEAVRRITEIRKNLEELFRMISAREEYYSGLRDQAEIAQRVITLKEEEKRLALLLFSLERTQRQKELEDLLREEELLHRSLEEKRKELDATYNTFQELSLEEDRDGRRRRELKEEEGGKVNLKEKCARAIAELNREEEIGREEIATLAKSIEQDRQELEEMLSIRSQIEEKLVALSERRKTLEEELALWKTQKKAWLEEEGRKEKARSALREEIVEALRVEAYLRGEVEGFVLRLKELRALKERRERFLQNLEEEVEAIQTALEDSIKEESAKAGELSLLKERRVSLEKEIAGIGAGITALEEKERESRRSLQELEEVRGELLQGLKKLFPLSGREGEFLFAWDGVKLPDSKVDLWDTILGSRLRVLKPHRPQAVEELAKDLETLPQRITLFVGEDHPYTSSSSTSSRYLPLDHHLSLLPGYEWVRYLLRGVYLSTEPLDPPAIPPDLPEDLVELWDEKGVAYIPGRGFSLGPLERSGVSHIRFQLAEVEERIQKEVATQKEIHRKIQEAKGILAQREVDLSRLMEEEAQKEEELKELKSQRSLKQLELERGREERDSLREELDLLEEEEGRFLKEMEEKESSLKEMEAKRKSLEEELRRITEELMEGRKRWEGVAQKEEELQSELERILAEIREVSQNLHEAEYRFKATTQRIQQSSDRLQSWQERLRKLGEERSRLLEEHKVLEEALAAIHKEIEGIEARSVERRALRKKLENQLVSCQKEIERLGSLSSRTEEKIQSLREKLSESERVFREVYGEEPEVTPPTEPVSREEIERGISRIRREIQEIGPVNYQAIEEVKKVEEELSRLQVEKEDLEEALRRSEKLLEEMEHQARVQFLSFLDSVNKEFYRLFEELSGGGKGELRLEDPQRIWESGVMISVQFPGSRRTRMELLSGGQKALTSLAFLCALFMTRPGPCLVLDEVDAPLDEVNLKRFHGLMERLSLKTQIILVTHHPLTMEIAQRIIGVTQRERGVSTLITYHLA